MRQSPRLGYTPSTESAYDERQDEKNQEDNEQELRNSRSSAGNSTETKQRGDDRQNKKCQSPTEHVCLHSSARRVGQFMKRQRGLAWDVPGSVQKLWEHGIQRGQTHSNIGTPITITIASSGRPRRQ